jgi:hypothetical protein
MRPAELIAAIRAQADEGIEHVIVNLPEAHRLDQITALGREVLPEVAEIVAA